MLRLDIQDLGPGPFMTSLIHELLLKITAYKHGTSYASFGMQHMYVANAKAGATESQSGPGNDASCDKIPHRYVIVLPMQWPGLRPM